MANVHTCTIGGVDLISPVVLVLHRHLVEVPCDVVGRSGVGIPVGNHTVTPDPVRLAQ